MVYTALLIWFLYVDCYEWDVPKYRASWGSEFREGEDFYRGVSQYGNW